MKIEVTLCANCSYVLILISKSLAEGCPLLGCIRHEIILIADKLAPFSINLAFRNKIQSRISM